MTRWLSAALLAVLAVSLLACGRGEEGAAPPTPPALVEPVPLPDMSAAAEAVQRQVRERHTAAAEIEQRGGPPGERMTAQAELGKLLMAAEYNDAAEVAFENARRLAPADMRWPYYLGHLARRRNDVARAAAHFEEALVLSADHVPSLVWLGEIRLGEGRESDATALFGRALSLDAGSAAALSGLGRAALTRGDYDEAVTRLEAALAMSPEATRLHYPLALAYRGQGNATKADEHLGLRGEVDLPPSDPLLAEIGALLQNAAAFETRAAQALAAREWDEAVSLLHQAIALTPDSAFAHLNLGTALYMQEDADGALEAYRAALRLQPGLARAHFGVGIVMEARGQDREATDAFAAAVGYDPAYVEARFSLANALRRSGRVRDSLAHYEEVTRLDPALSQAHFGHAMGLVRLGRYQEARRRLEQAMIQFPDQPGFAHALARVLAAAPADGVRDGARAVVIMRRLLEEQQTLAMAETMAMALAEVGVFNEAVAWQRDAIAFARSNEPSIVARLQENLLRYERGEPCRTPWTDDDPVHRPVPTTR